MRWKWNITPEAEHSAASQFQDCNIFSVRTATYIAAGIAQVSQQTLIDAYRCGSLHAHDWSGYFKEDEQSLRGGALRLAFHVDTVTAFAHVHAARINTVRQERAAALNANKPMFTTVSGLSPVKKVG